MTSHFPTPSEAEKIMGREACVPLSVAENLWPDRYTVSEREKMNTVGFSAEILEEKKDTHILLPGITVTLEEMVRRWQDLFGFPDLYGDPPGQRLEREERKNFHRPFMREPVPAEWLLCSRHIEDDSKRNCARLMDSSIHGRDFYEKKLLETKPGEQPLSAAEVVHYLLMMYQDEVENKVFRLTHDLFGADMIFTRSQTLLPDELLKHKIDRLFPTTIRGTYFPHRGIRGNLTGLPGQLRSITYNGTGYGYDTLGILTRILPEQIGTEAQLARKEI